MILVADVETSGLLVKDRPLGDPCQPRVVQLAFLVQDATRRTVHKYSTLITPDGWEISKEAAEVHGFSTQECSKYGVPAKVALLNFVSALKTVRIFVCHNLAFESAMIQRELDLLHAADQALERPRLRRFCTMRSGAALMNDGRWPSLERLYRLLTGREHTQAHDALGDAEATAEVFWGLHERRIIEL